MSPVIARIFDGPTLLALGGAALLVAIVRLVYGLIKEEAEQAPLRALESGLVTFAAGFIARTFLSLLLSAAADSAAASTTVTVVFLLPNALLELFAQLFTWNTSTQVFSSVDGILLTATIIGAFGGMMDGLWRTRRWAGLGWLSFPLDYTVGLAGIYLADLLHLIDLFAGRHTAGEGRRDVHRYEGGVRLRGNYALTQGMVMSNCNHAPGTPLWAHENTHVWQNRIFGFFFVHGTLIWFVLFGLIGIIPALVQHGMHLSSVVMAFNDWGYLSTPWEAWAYRVGESMGYPHRTTFGTMAMSDIAVIVLSIPFFLGMIALAVWIFTSVWLA